MQLGPEAMSPEEVRRRFRWARRQGHPAWLWPEVSPDTWREALGRIEAVAREVLRDGSASQPLHGDAAALGLAGYTSGMGPLLGLWIEAQLLAASGRVAEVFARHLRHNRMRAARLQAEAARVVTALAGAGVEVTVLKGAHTGGTHFPEPGVRPASDIDLLVRPGDGPAAEAVLRRLGLELNSRGERESSWRPANGPAEPRSLSFVHAEDPWSVDLHHSLDLFVSAGAPVASLDRLGPMQGRGRWAPQPCARVLDQPALLLHLAVHAGMGLQNLTLLRLVELVLVTRGDVAAGALSWTGLLAAGDRAGVLGYAFPALSLAEQLVPGTVPPWVLARCARRAPDGVCRVLSRLTPAGAQRIDRSSLQEHFMWSRGWAGRLRQLGADLVPAAGSWRKLWWIYEQRAWRLIRGRFSP